MVKKTEKEIEAEILDDCNKILSTDSVIVYSTTRTKTTNTDFIVYKKNGNKPPKETIFKICGPSNGYLLIIPCTNISIDGGFSGSKQEMKLLNLYSATEEIFDKQKDLRSEIENLKRINSLKLAHKKLQQFREISR